MRAIVLHEIGGPQKLHIEDVETPVAGVYPPGELRVTHFDSVRDPARIVAVVVRTLYELRGG